MDRLLSDLAAARRMGEAGRRIVVESRGATQQTLQRLEPVLERSQ
jgi:hypothetical protein